MKTSKIITILIILGIIGFFAFILLGKKSDIAYTPPAVDQTPSIKGCYVATLGKDVYTLKILSEEGENFKGTLSFKNFQKDSSSGTFTGRYRDGILLGDYSFDSEGTHSIVQVIFKKTDNGFLRGFGDMNETGDRFADLSKIDYSNGTLFEASPDCEPSQSFSLLI